MHSQNNVLRQELKELEVKFAQIELSEKHYRVKYHLNIYLVFLMMKIYIYMYLRKKDINNSIFFNIFIFTPLLPPTLFSLLLMI